MQNATIYIPSDLMKTQTYISSTKLGQDDDLKISVGEFLSGETKRFIGSYLSHTQVSNDDKALGSNELLIVPELSNFGFGFYSADGFEVSAKPFVSYDLRLKIFKKGKLLYNKFITTNERNFGENEFFGGGQGSYAQLTGIFQKAISNDYALHAREIVDTINLAD